MAKTARNLIRTAVAASGLLAAHAALHRWMAASDIATRLLSSSVELQDVGLAAAFFMLRAAVFFVLPGVVLFGVADAVAARITPREATAPAPNTSRSSPDR